MACILSMPLGQVWAKQAAVNMDEFAYGAELTMAETDFQRVTLTADMFRHIQRRDRGDIRVYDEDNELMPSLVLNKSGHIKISKTKLKVSPYVQGSKRKGYIVDRGANHKQWLQSLQLHWHNNAAPNILSIRVEHSADEKNWSSLSKSEVVSNFKFADTMLRINDIDINNHTKRFIRLTFLDSRTTPSLASATAYTTSAKPAGKIWVPTGELKPVKSPANTYRFSVSRGISPSHLRFSFGKLNTLLAGSLYSMENKNGKPAAQLRTRNFQAYKVTLNNKVINAKATDIARWRASDWLITTNASSNIEANGLPDVIAGYSQHEVIFAADGDAPYTLVWGNAAASKPATTEIGKRIRSFAKSGNTIAVVTPGKTLDKTALVKLVKSRQWSFFSIVISLFALIGAAIAGRMAYQRFK